jgi:hypothetical protein
MPSLIWTSATVVLLKKKFDTVNPPLRVALTEPGVHASMNSFNFSNIDAYESALWQSEIGAYF